MGVGRGGGSGGRNGEEGKGGGEARAVLAVIICVSCRVLRCQCQDHQLTHVSVITKVAFACLRHPQTPTRLNGHVSSASVPLV